MPDLTHLPIDLISEFIKDRDIFKLSLVYVAGVEVTQAIQWFEASRHLTDPADRGPDNGVSLVANKPAWVRIYVGGFIEHHGIAGTLSLQRRNGLGVWENTFTPIGQWPATVNFDPADSYATVRGSLGNTLNFVIPADQMHGSFRLVASIQPASGNAASRTINVDATLLQTLQIRGIPIRYWGQDAAGNQVQLGPTTAADFANTATWTMLTYPVENVPSISLAGIFTWSETLAGAPAAAGGCSTGWNDLLFWLHIAKVVDGMIAGDHPDFMYYGLLPVGTPDGPVIGCDSGDVSAGIAGDGVTMAHELGHYQGFPHAPCGNVGTPDPGYPAYEPYDTPGARTASIGEFGLDISNGALYDPATAKDYMSYCGPRWTSLYHYKAQIGSSWFNPRYISTGDRPPWWDSSKLYRRYWLPRDLPYPNPVEEYLVHEASRAELKPAIVVSGLLQDGKLEVRSVLRLDAFVGGGIAGEERLEILDSNGEVVSAGALRHQPLSACGNGCGCGHGASSCGCGCHDPHGACPRIVTAVVPDSAHAATMRIVRGEEKLWSRDAPDQAPAIKALRAEVTDAGLSLEWQTPRGRDLETHLRISSDEGKTWRLLELRVQSTRTSVPLAVIAPGRHWVAVLASDGFHTATSESVEITVPQRAPTAAIHWPLQTATVAGHSRMRLWGSGMSAGTKPLPDDAHIWSIDGIEVGRGRDLWVAPPVAEGEHIATLTVCDEHGTSRVSSRFWVSSTGLAPRRLSRD